MVWVLLMGVGYGQSYVTRGRCEGVPAPLAVEEGRPRLTWEYVTADEMPAGALPAGARVVVARSHDAAKAGHGEVWDSGWETGDLFGATYAGPGLEPGVTYWWSVAARLSGGGGAVGFSDPLPFRMAERSWVGQWIQAPWSTERDGAEVDGSRPMPVFRREFTLKAKPVEAVLRIAGLGQYDARLNGHHVVLPRGLHQAWTDYKKTVTYDSYNLTDRVTAGPNVLAVMLGNGMYNVQRSVMANGKARYTKFEGSDGPPKMIAEVRVRYADGTSEVVGTDAGWKAARGPVMFSSTYGGEDYDARRLEKGYDRAGFSDKDWTAVSVGNGPGGRMMAAMAPPVHRVREFATPVVTDAGSGRLVYDFGQNMAGRPRMVVEGPAGAVLKLTPGELLKPDGTVSQGSSGGPMWWSFTTDGGKAAGQKITWEPSFGYYGFRYLQAEWVGNVAGKVDRMAAVQLSSDSEGVGSFESSSEMLNGIHGLIVEAMHNNEVSLFTDCPHREKLGWLEETHLVAAGLIANNDVEGLYRATDRNMADAQHADGMVPTIAPQYTRFGPKYPIYDDSPEWGSAAVLGPWAAYKAYGDIGELRRSYPMMKGWVRYLEGRAVDGIVDYGLGDWYDIGPGGPGFSKLTTAGVTGTLMLYEDAVAMERVAGIVGRAEDAAGYRELAVRERVAFQRRFWNEGAGYYDTGSQTANAMPLALGLVPEDRRAAVLAHVIADIHEHEDHVTSGEVGYPYLLRALMAAGRSDVVLAMMLREDAPSYGSQIAAGATALTEAWDANPKSSQDHFMLGGAEEWFYRGLGGIDVDMGRAERIVVRPETVVGVDWIKTGYMSRLGQIESDWQREGDATRFEVTVPAGAQATVMLPDGGVHRVSGGMHTFVVKERAQ
jgi:hypothetical protein